MTIKNLAKETFASLTANKSRTALTMLGIVIGITSVITMLAVGNGANNSIQSSIQGLGANLLQVYPGSQRTRPGSLVSLGKGSVTTLNLDDAEAIATRVQYVTNVAPVVSSQSLVISKSANTSISVTGTTPNYAPVRSIDIAEGSFITDKHVRSVARVAVIGPTTRDDLFGVGQDAIGQTLRIKNIEFTVIGVTVAKGGSGFANPDDQVYIPLSVAQQMITGNRYLSSIDMQVLSTGVMEDAKSAITEILLKRHNITDPTQPDFRFLDQATISATVSSVTSIFTALLGSIAGISLIVGGIGIMNMMLTSVTERTREIGLRKAVGARRRDISNQFLFEAVTLTLIGGLFGVLCGYLFSFIITLTGLLEASVTTDSVLLAFGVATATGLVFGYFPARRAASLNPIDALRYE